MKLYKIWKTSLTDAHLMYIWANDADEALAYGRKAYSKVNSIQWTGIEDPKRIKGGIDASFPR